MNDKEHLASATASTILASVLDSARECGIPFDLTQKRLPEIKRVGFKYGLDLATATIQQRVNGLATWARFGPREFFFETGRQVNNGEAERRLHAAAEEDPQWHAFQNVRALESRIPDGYGSDFLKALRSEHSYKAAALFKAGLNVSGGTQERFFITAALRARHSWDKTNKKLLARLDEVEDFFTLDKAIQDISIVAQGFADRFEGSAVLPALDRTDDGSLTEESLCAADFQMRDLSGRLQQRSQYASEVLDRLVAVDREAGIVTIVPPRPDSRSL